MEYVEDPSSSSSVGTMHHHTPGEGNGNLLQASCLENHVDRETWKAWQAI